MASISDIYSASPTIKHQLKSTSSLLKGSISVLIVFPGRVKSTDQGFSLSVAREVSAELAKKGLVNDPQALCQRYVDWLYQHKELGLFLDVSRVGFTDEFVSEMEPRFQAVFKAMKELGKCVIANPNEGRIVGHHWLPNPKLAPTSFLRLQIKNTLEALRMRAAQSGITGSTTALSS